MREIKFRAWIRAGAWEEPDEMQQEYVMLYGDELAFEEYAPINELLASVEYLMQYTGLKDKNGKEIYEGDIVKFCVWDEYGTRHPRTEKVEWDGDYGYCGFIPFADPYDGEYIDKDLIEVIGNIYENKDLLNEESMSNTR